MTRTASYSKGTGVTSIGTTSNSCTIGATYNGTAQGTSCSVTLPSIGVASGFVVSGWYSGSTKKGNAGASLSLSSNISLVATASPNFTLSCPTSGYVGDTISCTTNKAGVTITCSGVSLSSNYNNSFTTTASNMTHKCIPTSAGTLKVTATMGNASLTKNVTISARSSNGTLAKSGWQDIAKEGIALLTLNTSNMPNVYQYNNKNYSLQSTMDISEEKNNSVILGTYSNGTDKIMLMGQNGGVVVPTDSSNLFSGFTNTLEMDLSNLDTSKVTDMRMMFFNSTSLTFLDLSNFDTSKAIKMGFMFMGCSSLTTLDLSSFNTSNVTNMSGMFGSCSKLTSLNLSSFNTSNVTDMSGMFSSCSKLTSLNLSNFVTSNVTNISSMFRNCSSLTSLDLSSFDTSKVTNMLSMFNNCNSLTSLDLSSFDTSNVTNMEFMFSDCTKITLACARTEADAEKLNTSSGKPTTWNFVVK